MILLFKRAQTAIGINARGLSLRFSRPKFKLWAKIECSPEEQSIISHYQFGDTVLVDSVQEGLFRRAAFFGFWMAVLSTLVLLPALGYMDGSILCVLFGIASAYLYYDRKRDIIFVRDLLAGRHFTCTSVVELARKEAWLEVLVAFLRQVMESAKHWDGTETLPIDPMDRDAAKQLIIRGL